MPLDRARTGKYIKEFSFKTLFTELLGWEHLTQHLDVTVDGKTYPLIAAAHKRGMVAFECRIPDKDFPPYPIRRKIDQQVTKNVREHIIIYIDAANTLQVWQWVKRETGKPTACREYSYHKGQSGEGLIQKLEAIKFSLDEEESLTLVDVTSRARGAFDIEKVTKKFYDRFKTEHDGFLKFIKGIPDDEMHRWYASVMLNRLMFIYFIQKKGFLDNNVDYLRAKLGQTKERGKDKFYSDLLCPLFFEGFAKKETDRSQTMNKLLGKVPYLNGGLFLKHQIEEQYGKEIRISDTAFEKIFGFFEQYQWHLDERPLKEGNEINPDVLGYIFEKYINQKQMGAYYTKEDITEYISKNTVIPYLFDAARQKCKIAFEGDNSIWRLLQVDPDRYIYDAVKQGMTVNIRENPPKPLDKPVPLPAEIEAGLDDVSKRAEWNKAASDECALPTEIWREVVARRKRYEEVRTKLASGEVRDINDLITYNLNIRQFAHDVIESSEGPELLRAFYHAIEKVTVLDPTCGSGAFLFAALNILEPLYEACLDRMEVFLSELERSGEKHRPEKYSDFKQILEQIEKHPNRKYFIFKSIIVNNLYGVDIMEEAIEICKLRLFLKLVAQVGDASKIEPLPDIDFNIRAGNTLVGYATYDEVKHAVTSKLDFDNAMEKIKEQAEDIDRLFKLFHQQQTEIGGEVTPESKQVLRKRLRKLEDELNRHLATEYGIDLKKKTVLEQWIKSHQPFHWFIEFYGLMNSGGFDVIIGNPPYVEYKDVKGSYTIRGFESLPCGDLYAFCTERAYQLLKLKGYVGLIVPISIFGTDGFATLQQLTVHTLDQLWVSFFANRPSQLFDGAQKRLTIFVGRRSQSSVPIIYTTRYYRWVKEEFDNLFRSRIEYAPPHNCFTVFPASLEKTGSSLEVAAFQRLTGVRDKLASAVSDSKRNCIYYTRKFGYFLAFLDFIPRLTEIKSGRKVPPSELKEICLATSDSVHIVIAALTSSTFFWFWNVLSDCRNLNRRDLLAFTINPDNLPTSFKTNISTLALKYLKELKGTSWEMLKSGLRIETFEYATCKPIIDEIDRVLAKHYGFTDEELDFIINYDIKYRMGRDAGENEEE